MTSRFGEKVRALRHRHGMNQSQLAARLGLSEASKGYISEIEHGKKSPPIQMVVQLADLFKVSTDSLLRDEMEVPLPSFLGNNN